MCFYLQVYVYNIVHIFAEKMFFIVTVITEGTQGDKLMAILEQFTIEQNLHIGLAVYPK